MDSEEKIKKIPGEIKCVNTGIRCFREINVIMRMFIYRGHDNRKIKIFQRYSKKKLNIAC